MIKVAWCVACKYYVINIEKKIGYHCVIPVDEEGRVCCKGSETQMEKLRGKTLKSGPWSLLQAINRFM